MLRLRIVLLAALVAVSLVLVPTTPVDAHAELRQSSPEAGETVGGEFHSIALQFIDLDVTAQQDAQLYDPAGDLIPSVLAQDGQRLVIPIDPLEVPGEYTVTYAVHGGDGDYTEESFTFVYDPSADPPKGITVAIGGGDEGFDLVGFALLLVLAGLLAFLVQRFLSALREHRAAQAAHAMVE